MLSGFHDESIQAHQPRMFFLHLILYAGVLHTDLIVILHGPYNIYWALTTLKQHPVLLCSSVACVCICVWTCTHRCVFRCLCGFQNTDVRVSMYICITHYHKPKYTISFVSRFVVGNPAKLHATAELSFLLVKDKVGRGAKLTTIKLQNTAHKTKQIKTKS